MPICCVPWSKTGVPNTTRSRAHNLGFILAEASTLHPLFILRHLKDNAAQKRQRGSLWLYTAFTDSKQAYDSIPRSNMWDYVVHLSKNQMPIHMLSILENLYDADEYTLLDGATSGCPATFWCETRVPPLPPAVFYLLKRH